VLRAKIDRKSAISLQCGQLDPNFHVDVVSPTNHFCTDSQANECLTTLSLTVFTQRNYLADVLQAKCVYTPKRPVLRFLVHYALSNEPKLIIVRCPYPPTSMTLNDLKRRNSLYFAFFSTEFDSFAGQLRHSGWR